MRELSTFVDESGSDGLSDRHCPLTVVYRSAQPCEYRLSQVADCICTMELTAIKFAEHATTATDEKFFGKWSDFKKGILKETRKKLV